KKTFEISPGFGAEVVAESGAYFKCFFRHTATSIEQLCFLSALFSRLKKAGTKNCFYRATESIKG
ncbi:MAG: hypothetical protein D3923_08815, partial [Candidatus Electrothrix sp. AR3]|nr:hypothetical protein [Candidatus Electrothrix sp. AR3]